MLEKQSWMKFAPELYLEWRQASEEGLDVAALEKLCYLTSEASKREDCEEIAELIWKKLKAAPVRKDYLYYEPSDLAGIQAAAPIKRHHFSDFLTKEQKAEKLKGAWIGRISGCLLGKPVEGFKRDKLYAILKQTNNYPMNRYIRAKEFTPELKKEIGYDELQQWQLCYADQIKGCSPADDDTNYTVLAMKIVENYGRNFRPNDVLEAWLTWMPMFSACTAERAAYRNAAMGICAPQTAEYKNPYREWIGAQIRGDFYGYINPAEPAAAAEMAWRDASVSHVKNGIYGEMLVAAMLAAASVCNDIKTIIEAGLDEIPEKCRLKAAVEKVILWYEEGRTAEEVIEKIHQMYDEHSQHDWCHTISNAMIVIMALLYGGRDFSKTVCLAVQAAFDTDCNGATAGSIVGMILGQKGIPEEWYECYQETLATGIMGYPLVTVDDLVAKTMELII
ncbi:MAG TPA: ADP-ribosylglycohydrolase family protein [Candidatus Eisenbergiella merdipullorum]|uniref:ADP-ribosylglycohydrolase family protein n=1 Tax=Candidatus Eisenbergiella merdipullorum TaxID=2838553 RepID=A0A9D2I7Q0_9FIRM|nr:ADP-ribosylglycohydrolase family protein [Candidatus Eisenbergiella merdipullorum]